jgi:hypothetical protein
MKICPESGNTCSWNCSDCAAADDDSNDDSSEEDFVHVNVNGTEIIQSSKLSSIHLKFTSAQWFKVTEMNEIFNIFDNIGNVPYVLVGGNTARGKS